MEEQTKEKLIEIDGQTYPHFEIQAKIEDLERKFNELKNESNVSVGEISITSRCGLPLIRKELKSLLKDKQIKDYLHITDLKKGQQPYWLGALS